MQFEFRAVAGVDSVYSLPVTVQVTRNGVRVTRRGPRYFPPVAERIVQEEFPLWLQSGRVAKKPRLIVTDGSRMADVRINRDTLEKLLEWCAESEIEIRTLSVNRMSKLVPGAFRRELKTAGLVQPRAGRSE